MTEPPPSHGPSRGSADRPAGHPVGRTQAHRTPSHRLFIAIWPPEPAVTHLHAALEAVGPTDPALRWQPPGRWHLTLAFLGAVDPSRNQRRLAKVHLPPPEPIRLASAGAFGPILWAGVEHGPWLAQLADRLQGALHVADRRFRAHVTIARARGPQAVAAARAAASGLADYSGPWWTPGSVTLVGSVGGPAPRYDVLASRALPDARDERDVPRA